MNLHTTNQRDKLLAGVYTHTHTHTQHEQKGPPAVVGPEGFTLMYLPTSEREN